MNLALACFLHSRPRRSHLQCMNYGGGPVKEELAEGAPSTEAPCPFDAGLRGYAETPLDPAPPPAREPVAPRSRGIGGAARPRSQGSRHPEPAGDFAGVTAALGAWPKPCPSPPSPTAGRSSERRGRRPELLMFHKRAFLQQQLHFGAVPGGV